MNLCKLEQPLLELFSQLQALAPTPSCTNLGRVCFPVKCFLVMSVKSIATTCTFHSESCCRDFGCTGTGGIAQDVSHVVRPWSGMERGGGWCKKVRWEDNVSENAPKRDSPKPSHCFTSLHELVLPSVCLL